MHRIKNPNPLLRHKDILIMQLDLNINNKFINKVFFTI